MGLWIEVQRENTNQVWKVLEKGENRFEEGIRGPCWRIYSTNLWRGPQVNRSGMKVAGLWCSDHGGRLRHRASWLTPGLYALLCCPVAS